MGCEFVSRNRVRIRDRTCAVSSGWRCQCIHRWRAARIGGKVTGSVRASADGLGRIVWSVQKALQSSQFRRSAPGNRTTAALTYMADQDRLKFETPQVNRWMAQKAPDIAVPPVSSYKDVAEGAIQFVGLLGEDTRAPCNALLAR